MTSVQPRFTDGPRTYVAGETIDGGQLVEARAGSVIGVAGDASKKVLGVAQKKAVAGTGLNPRVADGAGVLDATLAPSEVAILADCHVPVTYSAACAFGALVAAAPNGQVRPWITADGADAIVGRCVELAGVALGAVGLTRINL